MSHYEKPLHGWTCFHCGETFTTVGSARSHFGAEPTAQPGCIERVRLGGERGLLMALRDAEERIARYMRDDSDNHRALLAMQQRQATALRDAEEAGYERGLRDSREALALKSMDGTDALRAQVEHLHDEAESLLTADEAALREENEKLRQIAIAMARELIRVNEIMLSECGNGLVNLHLLDPIRKHLG